MQTLPGGSSRWSGKKKKLIKGKVSCQSPSFSPILPGAPSVNDSSICLCSGEGSLLFFQDQSVMGSGAAQRGLSSEKVKFQALLALRGPLPQGKSKECHRSQLLEAKHAKTSLSILGECQPSNSGINPEREATCIFRLASLKHTS